MGYKHHAKDAYHSNDNAAFSKAKLRDKVDRIHNPTLTERERALEALARMKELERQRKSRMVSVQADPRTVISSCTKKRAAELTKDYLDGKL